MHLLPNAVVPQRQEVSGHPIRQTPINCAMERTFSIGRSGHNCTDATFSISCCRWLRRVRIEQLLCPSEFYEFHVCVCVCWLCIGESLTNQLLRRFLDIFHNFSPRGQRRVHNRACVLFCAKAVEVVCRRPQQQLERNL